jgi:hypothetical protein
MGQMSLMGVLLSLSASTALRIHVDESIDCPSRSQLQAALDAQLGPGGTSPPSPGSSIALLELSRNGEGEFVVRLSNAAALAVAERHIRPRAGSCEDLARTIALLVSSWLRDMTAASSLSATPPAGAHALPSREPIAAPLEGQPAAVEARSGRVSPWRPRVPSLALGLAVEAVAGTGAALGGTATIEVSLSTVFALGAQLSVIGTTNARGSNGGSLQVDRQVGALFAALTLVAPASARSPSLALLGGATLLRYAAQAQGYPESSQATGCEPGLFLGLRGAQPIYQSLFIYGELDAHATANTLHFQVANGGGASTTLTTLPAFWPSLSLGFGADFL